MLYMKKREAWEVDLGRMIKKCREKRGLTQLEAATEYGCQVRYWQEIERGLNLSVAALRKVAKVLHVPAWKLLK